MSTSPGGRTGHGHARPWSGRSRDPDHRFRAHIPDRLTVGPDGAFYVSDQGVFGFPAGQGQVLRITTG